MIYFYLHSSGTLSSLVISNKYTWVITFYSKLQYAVLHYETH